MNEGEQYTKWGCSDVANMEGKCQKWNLGEKMTIIRELMTNNK